VQKHTTTTAIHMMQNKVVYITLVVLIVGVVGFGSDYNGQACINDSDMKQLTNATVAEAALVACADSCYSSGRFQSCVTTCMQGTLRISVPCSSCFGQSAYCGKVYCALDCLAEPTSEACVKCAGEHCGDSFTACSGLTPPFVMQLI